MTNLTLVIDDDVLRRARIRALEEGTSVNAVVRGMLSDYAGAAPGSRANIQGFLDLARRNAGSSGPVGRAWTRDDLYDRPLDP